MRMANLKYTLQTMRVYIKVHNYGSDSPSKILLKKTEL